MFDDEFDDDADYCDAFFSDFENDPSPKNKGKKTKLSFGDLYKAMKWKAIPESVAKDDASGSIFEVLLREIPWRDLPSREVYDVFKWMEPLAQKEIIHFDQNRIFNISLNIAQIPECHMPLGIEIMNSFFSQKTFPEMLLFNIALQSASLVGGGVVLWTRFLTELGYDMTFRDDAGYSYPQKLLWRMSQDEKHSDSIGDAITYLLHNGLPVSATQPDPILSAPMKLREVMRSAVDRDLCEQTSLPGKRSFQRRI